MKVNYTNIAMIIQEDNIVLIYLEFSRIELFVDIFIFLIESKS